MSFRPGWLARPSDPLVSAFLVLGLHQDLGRVTKILCVTTLWDAGRCSVGHAQVVALFLEVNTAD